MGGESLSRRDAVDMGAQVPMAMTRSEYLKVQAADADRFNEGVIYESVDGISLRLVLGGKNDQQSEATATPPVRNENWQADRACLGADPDIFILETVPKEIAKQEGAVIRAANRERLNLARKICATCVVHDECLGYAMRNPSVKGIQGGLTERERKRLSRG